MSITPKTLTQNLILWGLALLVSVLLAILNPLGEQMSTDEPIRWRSIFVSVIHTLTTVIPIVAAGFGLPKLGGEVPNALIKEVGHDKAIDVLTDVAASQGASRPYVNLTELAKELLEERDRRLADVSSGYYREAEPSSQSVTTS